MARSQRAVAVAGIATLVLAIGCGEPAPSRPDATWPDGALASARAEALRGVLARLASLERTPLAEAAARLEQALPACDEIAAHAGSAAGLGHAAACAERVPAAEGLRTWRADADLALALPLGGPGTARLLMRARSEGSDLHVTLDWAPSAEPQAVAALLPGSAPAGPLVLSHRNPLLHARVRVDGALDLAALVPPGSQGDQLFRLKGELLSAAVLDGTWELALYPPRAGGGMPGVALALGIRSRTAAEAAARRLLDDVEGQWSVRRTPLQRNDDRGACLLSLNLLPELAPCYLATSSALVLAWNPPSLERAMAATPAAPGPPSASSAAVGFLDLDALHAVDLRLATQVGEGAAPPTAWPWRRIRATGERRDGALRFELAFEASPRGHEAKTAAATPAAGSQGS